MLFLLTKFRESNKTSGKWQTVPRFSLPGGQEVTNLEMAQAIAKRLGKQFEYKLVEATDIRPGYDRHYPGPDDSLIRLGFVPSLSLWDGLEWIKSEGRHPIAYS